MSGLIARKRITWRIIIYKTRNKYIFCFSIYASFGTFLPLFFLYDDSTIKFYVDTQRSNMNDTEIRNENNQKKKKTSKLEEVTERAI